MTPTTTPPSELGAATLLAFLRGKLADAEKALRARETMANAKPITGEQYEEWSKMPGCLVTKGKRLSKAAIKELIAQDAEDQLRQKRIAIKCRHDVEMFRAVLNRLTECQHNTAKDQGWTECPTCDAILEANVSDQ